MNQTHLGWTDDRKQRVRDLVDEGVTNSKIAIEMGVSRNAIVGVLERMGIRRGVKRQAVISASRSTEVPLPQRPQARATSPSEPIPVVPPPAEEAPRVSHQPVALLSNPFEAPAGDFTICLHEIRARGDCRWPYGDRAPYQFCGRPTASETAVYCEAHAARARPKREAA